MLFGAGPRACFGAQFALTEATRGLAALTRAFRIELAEDHPVPPLATITLQPTTLRPSAWRRADSPYGAAKLRIKSMIAALTSAARSC